MKQIHTDVAIIGGGIVGTWLARELVRRNVRVVLIERGEAGSAADCQMANDLHSTARDHLGSQVARNIVLGGNGAFWGGGLIRQDRDDAIWGGNSIDIDGHYEQVEKMLKFPRPPARSTCQHGNEQWTDAEIFVLPGRSRNISAQALSEISHSSNAEILTNSQIKKFQRHQDKPSIASMIVTVNDAEIEIKARSFVISSGVIDSNLIIMDAQKDLCLDTSLPIGRGLHDHLSVPLFRLAKTGKPAFLDSVALRFLGGFVIGKRSETRIDDQHGTGGLVHFQYLFDEVSPYRELKELSSMVQRRAGLTEITGKTIALAPHIGSMFSIAFKRILYRQLHINSNVPVVATLDFESCGSLENSIEPARDGKKAAINWDLQPEDEKNFAELANFADILRQNLEAQYDIRFEPLFDVKDARQMRLYLRKNALDAYHLGGGLAVGTVLDEELRIRGLENLFVISTAAFARPGLVNPVLTLLALASRFADHFQGGR